MDAKRKAVEVLLHLPFIFHSIFETFVRRISDPNFQPPFSLILETQELMRSASIITNEKAGKAKYMCIKLSRIIGQLHHGIVNFEKTSPEAAGLCYIDGIVTPFAVIEIECEYGDGGYDLETRASFSFQRNWRSIYVRTSHYRSNGIYVTQWRWTGVGHASKVLLPYVHTSRWRALVWRILWSFYGQIYRPTFDGPHADSRIFTFRGFAHLYDGASISCSQNVSS